MAFLRSSGPGPCPCPCVPPPPVCEQAVLRRPWRDAEPRAPSVNHSRHACELLLPFPRWFGSCRPLVMGVGGFCRGCIGGGKNQPSLGKEAPTPLQCLRRRKPEPHDPSRDLRASCTLEADWGGFGSGPMLAQGPLGLQCRAPSMPFPSPRKAAGRLSASRAARDLCPCQPNCVFTTNTALFVVKPLPGFKTLGGEGATWQVVGGLPLARPQ